MGFRQGALREPDWFRDGKFGIMMHWGIDLNRASERVDVRYMYGGNKAIMDWHTEHFGPPTKFGYKDFIPMYTAAQWDPDAGRTVQEVRCGTSFPAENTTTGFPTGTARSTNTTPRTWGLNATSWGTWPKPCGRWDSRAEWRTTATPISISFPLKDSDEYDPEWADFYSVADRSNAARVKFLEMWVTKNMELIDKYQPDMLWFDMNGGDRSWDPLKLRVAAYYYNRAAAWKKQVTIMPRESPFSAVWSLITSGKGACPRN